MESLEDKLKQLRLISEEKDRVESKLSEILLLKERINNPQDLQPAIEFTGCKPIDLPQEINNRIATVIETFFTTKREKLIIEAGRLIGPTEYEEPKENETVPTDINS